MEIISLFIAYAASDRQRARELAAALERRHRRAYLPDLTDAGTDAAASDERALRQARVCVVLVSPQGEGDGAHRARVAAAIELRGLDPVGRRVVPVLLDGVRAADLRRCLGLANVTPIEPQALAADKMAQVAERLDDLVRRLESGTPQAKIRIAVTAVEEELGEALRLTQDALAPLTHVGQVELVDAQRPEAEARLQEFDFVVALVGARLGQRGLFRRLLRRDTALVTRTAALDLAAIEASELLDVVKLHKAIESAFGHAQGAADLARERVARWLRERFLVPSGGQGVLEPWEREYLTAKRVEWAGSRHAPLSAYAAGRDLRRAALYVSLYAHPQPWCHVDAEGRFIVRPRTDQAEMPADGPPANPSELRAPYLEQAISHPELPVIVLEGESGMGKSALLQHVAYVLACRHLGDAVPEHHLDLAALQAGAPLLRVPVVLDARRIAEEIQAHGIESAVREAIARAFSGVSVVGPCTVLDGLRRGRYLLLVDAVDEVPGVAQRDQVLHALAAEAAKAMAPSGAWPLRLVVTTRPTAYTGVSLPVELPALRLAAMTEGDAERMIERWALAQGRPPGEQAALREALVGVRERHGIDNVLENPLLLTCLLLVYEQRERLPDSTAALYDRMVEVLSTARDNPSVRPEEKRQALEILCRGMQELGGTQWPLPAAAAALMTWRPGLLSSRDKAEDFVCQLALETGLLRLEQQRRAGGGEMRLVRPWHRSFQEFLAARSLAAGVESVETKTRSLFAPRASGGARVEDPAWEGVLRFLVGVHGQTGDANARMYVETLHAALPGPVRREGRILGLVASALSEYAECFEGHALLEALPREIVAAFEARGSRWPWRDRVLALEALGRLPSGDPRLTRDAWVRFDAACFTMGGDPEAYQSAPRHKVRVREFWLRRWPVTVAEYAAFMRAGGYADETLWDVAPETTEPWWWQAQQRHPNRPVVGVNWFEARAFCRWAQAAGWAPEDHVISLPTEEEWEYAARGGRRTYAWGDEDAGVGDQARAAHDWGGDAPVAATPVGAFPAGHSPEGVWDLTGNVWEWTACRWRSTDAEWRHGNTECHRDDVACLLGERRDRDRRGAPRGVSTAPRAVWGGSWIDHPKDLRAARRDSARPGERDVFLGFRLRHHQREGTRPALGGAASRLAGCRRCRDVALSIVGRRDIRRASTGRHPTECGHAGRKRGTPVAR